MCGGVCVCVATDYMEIWTIWGFVFPWSGRSCVPARTEGQELRNTPPIRQDRKHPANKGRQRIPHQQGKTENTPPTREDREYSTDKGRQRILRQQGKTENTPPTREDREYCTDQGRQRIPHQQGKIENTPLTSEDREYPTHKGRQRILRQQGKTEKSLRTARKEEPVLRGRQRVSTWKTKPFPHERLAIYTWQKRDIPLNSEKKFSRKKVLQEVQGMLQERPGSLSGNVRKLLRWRQGGSVRKLRQFPHGSQGIL